MTDSIVTTRKPTYHIGKFTDFEFVGDNITDTILEITDLDDYFGSYRFENCTFTNVYFDFVSVDDYIFENCIFQSCEIESDDLYFGGIDDINNQLIDCNYIEIFN